MILAGIGIGLMFIGIVTGMVWVILLAIFLILLSPLAI